MTSLVGIYCKDGCVIGADSAITIRSAPSTRTSQHLSEKIELVENLIIIAGAGPVGLMQRFHHLVKLFYEAKGFQKHFIEIGELISSKMNMDINRTYHSSGEFGALVAFPCQDKHYLCQFETGNFQPEFKNERLWYCSMGSAQSITDPFLGLMREIYWQDGIPTVTEAVFAATWTLEHAFALNTGGVSEPMSIAVLERDKQNQLSARLISDQELDEHRQSIAHIKNSMREYRTQLRGESSLTVPDVPKLG